MAVSRIIMMAESELAGIAHLAETLDKLHARSNRRHCVGGFGFS